MRMPSAYVPRVTRVAHVDVLGVIWLPPVKAVQTVQLSDYDLDNIGEFSREAFDRWLRMNRGDFQEILDFSAEVGDSVIPWQSEDHEYEFQEAMWPSEE